MKYCEAIDQTKRFNTREVRVGCVGVGGSNPIRIQSMTTTNTRDVEATVRQIIHLADCGCEIVRVTVQGKKEAYACQEIKNKLIQKGYHIPIVADIHFYPPAAITVVEYVDKVRINPGNFVDLQKGGTSKGDITARDAFKAEQVECIFAPLIEKCIKLNKALRIGTNQGSLSNRMMRRYGDTPLGMVESALEFARICFKYDFHNVIFSMKSSNPFIMIQAYRLLVARMIELGWNYPLHLGVTEAGHGEEGRVKSAVGIGTLLLDGLGDTIRVSLTEEPTHEIIPCRHLIHLACLYQNKQKLPFIELKHSWDPLKRKRFFSDRSNILHRDGAAMIVIEERDLHRSSLIEEIQVSDTKQFIDALYVESLTLQTPISRLKSLGIHILTRTAAIPNTLFVKRVEEIKPGDASSVVLVEDGNPMTWQALVDAPVDFILLKMNHSPLHQGRYFFKWLIDMGLHLPVILFGTYLKETALFSVAGELGALMIDGYGDGVLLQVENAIQTSCDLAFNLLQACRKRLIKTEFISCPGCGRTLFELEQVTKKIRSKTSHLPGVKIAIMGCIVNGIGEMADADFGFVGSKTGKVDLYVGHTIAEKDIDFAQADQKLVELIRQEGRWIDPPTS